MEPVFPFVPFILGVLLGAGLLLIFVIFTGFGVGKKADKIIKDARKEAEKNKRDTIAELKAETFRLKQEAEKEIKEKKADLQDVENRLDKREKSLDNREDLLNNRDALLDKKDSNITLMQKEIQDKNDKMDVLLKQEMETLEKVAKFKKEKAHDLIMKRVESEMEVEIAQYVKDEMAEAQLDVDAKAKDLLVTSMQRYSNDVTNMQTTSTISLPNDEMKGRLIGREGRNIRTIEAVTGVDLIIDDTPEAITISSFDPFRREIAKQTIEILIKDGRIHPTRIEEIYDKVCNEMNQRVTELGKDAIYELGISKIDPELVNYIGKLNFRTSFGQNALQHSKEVANLCGLLAGELGENVSLAKRAGLLHDIGKSIDFETEGSHVDIGVELAKKYHEDPVVINAIASHHGDCEQKSIIAVLVQIADTLSAARPGARNDSLEKYVERLEQLESIGNSFDGVEKSYAMQAGREIRVIVKPKEVDDLKSMKLARDIKNKIEEEMQYPGTIKVTVIREIRAIEEAK